jgi:hypothetical protein
MEVIQLVKRKLNWEKLICGFVSVSLVGSAVYVIIMIFLAPPENASSAPDFRSKSDYILMLLECILGIFAMMLPGLLEHRINLVISSKMLVLYALFLYCAIYLGEVRSFYYAIPYWDNIMHFFSGCMLSTLGFSFIVLLNRTDKIPINLSPEFISVFTFCFAVTLGTLWEIYEYSMDGLFGLNMQKFALGDGTQLVGHAAVSDTMEDLVVDCISAFAISAVGYLSLKHKKGWIERFLLRIRRGSNFLDQ